MTRYELAGWLCRYVQIRRLERNGEHEVAGKAALVEDPLAGLPDSEQRNWLDMADAVLEFDRASAPLVRLRALLDDWDHYTFTLSRPRDEGWRDEMRRAVVVEMRAELNRLVQDSNL